MLSSATFPMHVIDGKPSAFNPFDATHQEWLATQYLAFWQVALPKFDSTYDGLEFHPYKTVVINSPYRARRGLSKVTESIIVLCKPKVAGDRPVAITRLTKCVIPVPLATTIQAGSGKMEVSKYGEGRWSKEYDYGMVLRKGWCPACAKVHINPDLYACSNYRNMPGKKAVMGAPVSYAAAAASSS